MASRQLWIEAKNSSKYAGISFKNVFTITFWIMQHSWLCLNYQLVGLRPLEALAALAIAMELVSLFTTRPQHLSLIMSMTNIHHSLCKCMGIVLLAFGCVSALVCVCQPWACLRHNSSTVQIRITKFGPDVTHINQDPGRLSGAIGLDLQGQCNLIVDCYPHFELVCVGCPTTCSS